MARPTGDDRSPVVSALSPPQASFAKPAMRLMTKSRCHRSPERRTWSGFSRALRR